MHKKNVINITQEILGKTQYFNFGYYYLYAFQSAFRESIRRIGKLKNIHDGERCFIIGNGPSLSGMDLQPLRDEITFGLNRIYLLFPKINFATTYLVSVNKLVVEQFGNEIQQAESSLKFFSYDNRHWLEFDPNTIYLYSRDGPRFYTNITKGIWQGATVTYVAIQIAYYLGIKQVILIGVDHSFSSQGQPHKTVVSQKMDTNHFDPDYFGKGVRWQLPDLETSEVAYRLAKEQFENDNRQILDATVNGKLSIFPKVNYATLFD
jgi:hypothetical protein